MDISLVWNGCTTVTAINGYDVMIELDSVNVLRDGKTVTRETVPGLITFLAAARDLRLGWAEVLGHEVVFIYDKADENFGYAVNLRMSWFSEWGQAPFR